MASQIAIFSNFSPPLTMYDSHNSTDTLKFWTVLLIALFLFRISKCQWIIKNVHSDHVRGKSRYFSPFFCVKNYVSELKIWHVIFSLMTKNTAILLPAKKKQNGFFMGIYYFATRKGQQNSDWHINPQCKNKVNILYCNLQ